MNDLKRLRNAWMQQRQNTTRRSKNSDKPIEFLLTFEQWLSIWQESGHLEERGRKKGQYVMSRKNDVGNYEVGNVFIQKTDENVGQAQCGKQKPERSKAHRKALSESHKGKPTWNKGLTATEAARKNMSLAKQGKPATQVSALRTCPHCSRVGGASAMTRYHFDNCKKKP